MKDRKITSPVKAKILALIEAAAGGSRTSAGFYRHLGRIKNLEDEWRRIDRDYRNRILREFRRGRLISIKELPDGREEMILTERGKQKLLRYDIDQMEIKKSKRWDGRWRLVIFDIPEWLKTARNALREKLRDLGFVELQKSVWIFPYPCRDEIQFISEFFETGRYIHLIEAASLSDDEKWRLHFDL